MQFQLGVGHKVAVTGHLRKQTSEGLLEAGGHFQGGLLIWWTR